MNNRSSASTSSFQAVKRRAISRTAPTWVYQAPFDPERPLPLVITPTVPGLQLTIWVKDHLPLIASALLKYGGILWRNFAVAGVAEFEQVLRWVGGELLDYRDRSSPRRNVQGKIYTSTDHPADQTIFLHSENSYAATWPLKLGFHCLTPAKQGGQTPVADTRRVLARIAPEIQAAFARRGVMYVRNFGDGFGLPWQAVFQTEDPAQVEQFCRAYNMTWEWKPGQRLRLCQVYPAIARHPQTQEPVWFNHAAFFHISTLDFPLQQALLKEFGVEDLPHNTYYGDGAQIEPEVIEAIRQAYRQEQVLFSWQAGDVLLLDNMLTAHGRMPYQGQRQVVVGMAEPISRQDLENGTEY